MPRERITTDEARLQVGPDGYNASEHGIDRGYDAVHDVVAPVFSIVWTKENELPVQGQVWLEAMIQIKHLRLLAEGAANMPEESWIYISSDDLSRWQANNLIKQTRRARDGSLGSDE